MPPAFLDEQNLCGGTLLRIVSRGSSILTELLRLSAAIPPTFLRPPITDAKGIPATLAKDSQTDADEYLNLLFDFRYLKNPDMFEASINSSSNLSSLEESFTTT